MKEQVRELVIEKLFSCTASEPNAANCTNTPMDTSEPTAPPSDSRPPALPGTGAGLFGDVFTFHPQKRKCDDDSKRSKKRVRFDLQNMAVVREDEPKMTLTFPGTVIAAEDGGPMPVQHEMNTDTRVPRVKNAAKRRGEQLQTPADDSRQGSTLTSDVIDELPPFDPARVVRKPRQGADSNVRHPFIDARGLSTIVENGWRHDRSVKKLGLEFEPLHSKSFIKFGAKSRNKPMTTKSATPPPETTQQTSFNSLWAELKAAAVQDAKGVFPFSVQQSLARMQRKRSVDRFWRHRQRKRARPSRCANDAGATHNEAFLTACAAYRDQKLARERLDDVTVDNTRLNTGDRFIKRLIGEQVLTSPTSELLDVAPRYRPKKARTDKFVRFRHPNFLEEHYSYKCGHRSVMFYKSRDFRVFKKLHKNDLSKQLETETAMDGVLAKCKQPKYWLARQRSNATGIRAVFMRALRQQRNAALRKKNSATASDTSAR